MIGHRILGRYLKNYWEGRGIVQRDKIIAIIMLLVTTGFSATTVATNWWGRILLLIIAVGVTIYLVKLKTPKKQTSVEKELEFPPVNDDSVHKKEFVRDHSKNT